MFRTGKSFPLLNHPLAGDHLDEIIFLLFCAILSNCISFYSVEDFGKLDMVRPELLMQFFQTLLEEF
ncbi:MAG: hypothetical protein Q4E67_06935 [Planctomycetia bacterium]|nr:hypothetical protein [Planctomycetia bacterium]